MDWSKREVDIKGDPEFLKELESIIDKHNPTDELWRYTGHISDILEDLHLNAKPYRDQRVYWTRAVFNKKGHLIITEEAAPWIAVTFADFLKLSFPDRIAGINYRVLY